MFCQLEYLRHCLRQRVLPALQELPETLDDTYDRMLEEIGKQNWEFAHRLFQCVASAFRPLLVEELAEFLAFDFDAELTPTYREDWREEDSAHAVLSTCSSLLAVVDVGDSTIIKFAHFSAQEYLTSKRLAEAKDTISHFNVAWTPAHTIVAQACLSVLLHINGDISEDDLQGFPLALYAAEHWVTHARFEGVSPNIKDAMQRLFDPYNHHLSVWLWIDDPRVRWHRFNRTNHPSQPRETPLHYAAYCGIHEVIEFLIVEREQDVNARGFDHRETPLGVASRLGHSEVARALLKHGADAEVRDQYDWTALERAAANGYPEVVRVLLELGADVMALDKYGNTPLHIAAMDGQWTTGRVLLEQGAEVNAKGKKNSRPLHRALNEGFARVLLEFGADINARDDYDRTPLHEVLEDGSTDVALFLLKNGANANARDRKKLTPLHLASRRGYLDVVRLLLLRGAKVNRRDGQGQTPFEVAYAEGHHDVMELLLTHGADDFRDLEQ